MDHDYTSLIERISRLETNFEYLIKSLDTINSKLDKLVTETAVFRLIKEHESNCTKICPNEFEKYLDETLKTKKKSFNLSVESLKNIGWLIASCSFCGWVAIEIIKFFQ